MIIAKIFGGLGNQMFQYSLGRYLAFKNKAELKLDLTEYKNYQLHQYSLNFFNIQAQTATNQEIELLKNKISHGVLGHFQQLITPAKYTKKPSHIIESKFSFDPNMLLLGDNLYLEGYWQTEKYFSPIANLIQNDFKVVNEPDEKNRTMIASISSQNSVSLHVRRGDYVTDKSALKVHGICSIDYYQQAVETICKKITNPSFFIFSDDPEWTKNNLKFDYPIKFVTHNGPEKNFEDLRLMSHCKHNIIANSTFSWWGAWLNANPDKIVIAPKNWFADPKINTEDLIPNNWIKN
jgi:hypothetical protein